MDKLPLITTIAAAFTSAWLLGLLSQRLSISPIVGYLAAGVLIGPHTPGFVGDLHLAHQLAEVGVILLMFGVGMHFHLRDLLAVKSVAIPGAIGQSAAATILAVGVFAALDLPLKSGIVLGLALAVASTVLLMRVLTDSDLLDSASGHVAVGWLLVEDVLTVIVLVLLPALGTQGAGSTDQSFVWSSLAWALVKLAALIAIVILGGSRAIPWVLGRVARLRSRELFTLTVLVFSVAIAAGSYAIFGASMALGAFLAGMMVAQSPASHQAAADALPLRDAFAVVFFVSVGMLFDPFVIVQEPLMLVGALGIVLIAKPLAGMAIVIALGRSSQTALTVGLGLAQIGEFSFILSDVARTYGLLPETGQSVIVATAILSIGINPFLFRALHPIQDWLRRRPRLWSLLNGRAERTLRTEGAKGRVQAAFRPEENHGRALVIGCGPVGRSVNALLRDAGVETVVVDLNIDTVADQQARGQAAIFGDASNANILEDAGIRHASHVIVTLPHSRDRAAVVATARKLKDDLRIMVRAHYLSERSDLERAGATAAVFEEAEAAVALARLVLADKGTARHLVDQSVRDLRVKLILENVSRLGSRTVRSFMVPWTHVRRLSTSDSLSAVLKQVAREHYSRWPVVDAGSDRIAGYLLTKDMVGEVLQDDTWTRFVRPLHTVLPDATIDIVLPTLQQEGSSICLVEDHGRPLGIVTIEDILGQFVGRIEDEYPRRRWVSLRDALHAGGVVLDFVADTSNEAIRVLSAAISPQYLPPDVDVAELAQAREDEIHTDIGSGVAIPHARCTGLKRPILVFGRSQSGIVFSIESAEPVKLLFLLVTSEEEPDVQVNLLGRIATVASAPSVRKRLRETNSVAEVLQIIAEADPSMKRP